MLCIAVTQWPMIDLVEPKQEPGHVRITPQITGVLREHGSAVVFGVDEGAPLDGPD